MAKIIKEGKLLGAVPLSKHKLMVFSVAFLLQIFFLLGSKRDKATSYLNFQNM